MEQNIGDSYFDFYFFRLRVDFIKSQTIEIDDPNATPSTIIRRSITDILDSSTFHPKKWYLGLPREIDDDSVVFEFGREKLLPAVEYRDRQFIKQPFKDYPNTLCYLDLGIELLAIAKHIPLCARPSTAATRLAELLSLSKACNMHGARITSSIIYDPREFLEVIRAAKSITQYSFTFAAPNPFDEDEVVVKPLQKALDKLNGNLGSVSFKGSDLNPDSCEMVTRSVVSVGQGASVSYYGNEDSKARTFKTGKNALIIRIEDAIMDDYNEVLLRIKNMYKKIREGDK